MLLYPVYALLFADAGLSTGQISSLFVIWSVVGFTLEIPSGALADAYSRRRIVAIAAVLRAIGFALWTFFREVRANRTVSRAVVLYAVVTGLGAIDEYVPLLARDMGAATALVPLLFVLPVAAMAIASLLADRWADLPAARLAAAVAVGGVLLAAGATAGHPAGMVAVALCFAVLELFDILTEARIQGAIDGPARATVLSVAGFGQEAVALAVYAGFGLGSAVLPVPALLALVAVPLVVSSGLTRRWLPHR